MNSREAYLGCLEFMEPAIGRERERARRIAALVEKLHGYRPTDLRVIELLLFVGGRDIRDRLRRAPGGGRGAGVPGRAP